MTVQEIIALGRDAKALLEQDMFQRAASHLRERTMTEWRSTAAGSTSLREDLFFQIHGLDAIEAQLRNWVEQAEYEAAKLEKAAAKPQR